MYITAQGCRLRNDLYCVEWDVKLYYTIPDIPERGDSLYLPDYDTVHLKSVLLSVQICHSKLTNFFPFVLFYTSPVFYDACLLLTYIYLLFTRHIHILHGKRTTRLSPT